ncbi:MAG: cytochrome b/b6 domain-containing protein [Betaproteobacteria bacterium]
MTADRHPLWAKILHWLHLAAMLILIFSGFSITYAHRAFLFPTMRAARQWHFYAMWILFWTLLSRLYFLCATGTWREFHLTRDDLRDLPKLGRYYLFLDRTPPRFGKYNPGQKLLYGFWPWLLAFQALTGFILYDPHRLQVIWLHSWLLSLNTVRTLHFLAAWFFVVTTAVHLYLVLIEGMDHLRQMATFRLPRRR